MDQEWIMKMLGIPTEAPQARTQDIDLPYEGPWGHVPRDVRVAILRAAEKHQLPEDTLFRQAQVESGFDPTAGSPKGARGLMQLMPLMQKHYGVEDPEDPMSNMDAGAQYMKELLKKYGGDYALALAAYNAGPTAVRRAGNRIPKFGETRRYVQKVLKGK
jgi:soluble lytic murein transglycosylase-like protein